MARPSRIFTIPSSAPFLPTLADALWAGRLIEGFPAAGDPLSLSRATIYLPTRRACRLMRDAFLQRDGVVALPRLIAIGDVDEEELVFAEVAAGRPALEIPPSIDPLERRLLLANLVTSWAQSAEVRSAGNASLVANTPTAALDLADALARLIDDMLTRQVDWRRLDQLVPDAFDPYWQLTLRFLKIAREVWPAILAERGVIESAERRDRLLAAEAERLASSNEPVIAAGSTASMPATARLFAAIAQLPNGAVVLPGLDTQLDEESWEKIGGTAPAYADASIAHPQFGMFGLLRLLEMHRDDVTVLGAVQLSDREHLLSEAMRPASATEHWNEIEDRDEIARGFENAVLIEAETIEEEALTLAVILREAVEQPGKTAALVTPDRALARRVIASLKRWDVAVDDSGGNALVDSAAGTFTRIAAEVALLGTDPVSLLALLKHGHFRLGRHAGGYAREIASLERAVLRGPRPARGTAGLAQALKLFAEERARGKLHRADPRAALSDVQVSGAEALVAGLMVALAPLEKLSERTVPVARLAQLHREVLDGLVSVGADVGVDDAMERIDEVLSDVAESPAAATLSIAPSEYPEFLEHLLSGHVLRDIPDARARVKIFGLLEARLQSVDRVVLGSLTENTWPPQTRSDPWLSRPMRQELGLDLPERRIGLTAHDFAQTLGTRDIVLSRSAKVGGAPTVPSRFLQRLQAVLPVAAWKAALARGNTYRVWARSLDTPEAGTPIREPLPKPPRDARPTRFSVTEIETWLRDPYSIYGKRILGLTKLDPVDTPPGARDRGSAVHGAIEDFASEYPDLLPQEAHERLIALGREAFEPLAAHPDAKAFWWPRFERIARWFVEWERARRAGLTKIVVEASGKIELPIGSRTFELRARADRIELRDDGRLAIVDYKTGAIASAKEVLVGFAPQLTLEAAIVRRGGFEALPQGGEIAALTYVQLRGGEPAGFVREIAEEDAWKATDPDREAAKALANLQTLLARFDDEAEPYRSLSRPKFRGRYGDYDLLARVKEWSATGGVAEDVEGPR